MTLDLLTKNLGAGRLANHRVLSELPLNRMSSFLMACFKGINGLKKAQISHIKQVFSYIGHLMYHMYSGFRVLRYRPGLNQSLSIG